MAVGKEAGGAIVAALHDMLRDFREIQAGKAGHCLALVMVAPKLKHTNAELTKMKLTKNGSDPVSRRKLDLTPFREE
jgi:hypothetical protein